VVIAGESLPHWIDPGTVTFLPVPFQAHKREHSGRNLDAILASDISEEFLWLNDDFFILEDREEFPIWSSGRTLRAHIEFLEAEKGKPTSNGRVYVDGLRDQLELLEEWGYPDPPSLEIHTPLPLRKSIIAPLLERARSSRPQLEAGFFRCLYYASGLPIEQLSDDVKIYGHKEPIPNGAEIVSSSPVSWNVGELGKQIRKQYWRRSPWEKPS
jgi:hypothetical protein